MDKNEKNAEVEALSDYFSRSEICLCADYRGLTVTQISNLRREIKKAGCVGRVVKNTLAKLSAKKGLENGSLSASGVDKFLEVFTGPTLLVCSFEDPIAPAKILTKFAKENEKLALKGAFFEGRFVDKAGIESLSAMPGKEELFGQLLRLINTPATNLLRVIQACGTQVVRVIDERRKQLE